MGGMVGNYNQATQVFSKFSIVKLTNGKMAYVHLTMLPLKSWYSQQYGRKIHIYTFFLCLNLKRPANEASVTQKTNKMGSRGIF